MLEIAETLLSVSQPILWTGFAVFVRLSAMTFVLPGFGEASVPARIKLAIAFSFTLILTPAITVEFPQPEFLSAVFLLAPEVIAGLFFGLMLRFFIFALQIAGSIAAQSTSLSQIFGGSAGVDPQPAIGRTLVIAGLALAALLGLHVQIARYMLIGYELIPFGVWASSEIVANLGVQEVSRAFLLGFTLASPFVIASLLYNITLGVINRAMPQLMVSFVGAPAITAGGLFLFFLTAPMLLGLWTDAFGAFMSRPFGGMR